MAKPALDIGMVFGSPKGGPMTGPDEDFKDLAHTALDGNASMGSRVDALHQLIKLCMDEKEAPEESAEGGESGESAGGY